VGVGAGSIFLGGSGVVLEGGPGGTRSITGRGVVVNATGVNALVQDLQTLTNSNAAAGILLNTAGSVRVLNNVITGNRFGIDVNGTGSGAGTRAWVQGNDLSNNLGVAGSPGAGIRVQGSPWVDAGQVSGGTDFTGLGGGGAGQGSTGGNTFNGYTSYSGTATPNVAQAILDLAGAGLNSQAGPHGFPVDLMAQGNTFNRTAAAGATNYAT